MFRKLGSFIKRVHADEYIMRSIYIGCTIAALALSTLLLVTMVRSEERSVEAAGPTASPASAIVVSSAPGEGETLPLEAELDEGKVTALIRMAVGDSLPLDDVKVRVWSADRVEVSAYVGDRLPEPLLKLAAAAINSALPDGWALEGVELRDGVAVFTLSL